MGVNLRYHMDKTWKKQNEQFLSDKILKLIFTAMSYPAFKNSVSFYMCSLYIQYRNGEILWADIDKKVLFSFQVSKQLNVFRKKCE